MSLNLSYRKNFVATKNEFELAMVNELSGFEILKFDCALSNDMATHMQIDHKSIRTNDLCVDCGALMQTDHKSIRTNGLCVDYVAFWCSDNWNNSTRDIFWTA